jgi:hypothetical protein
MERKDAIALRRKPKGVPVHSSETPICAYAAMGS